MVNIHLTGASRCFFVCVLSGAAEAHAGAEAAAGRALEACGGECDRARPDS